MLVSERTVDTFEGLYQRYAGRMRSFASMRGAADPDAIANDVMLRVYLNLDKFQGDEAAFVRWLYAIARNCIIDEHRKAQRRPKTTDASVPESHVTSAEDIAMTRLGNDDVAKMLDWLTVGQREVIALRLLDDLSLRDVSEIVGRPVSAVKSLQDRGLKRLHRGLMNEEGTARPPRPAIKPGEPLLVG